MRNFFLVVKLISSLKEEISIRKNAKIVFTFNVLFSNDLVTANCKDIIANVITN